MGNSLDVESEVGKNHLNISMKLSELLKISPTEHVLSERVAEVSDVSNEVVSFWNPESICSSCLHMVKLSIHSFCMQSSLVSGFSGGGNIWKL